MSTDGVEHAPPMGANCAVHRHTSGVPIESHHVWPLAMGGPNTKLNRVSVCANGHYEIHSYLELLVAGDGKVPWIKKLKYGPKVRSWAMSGFQRWKAVQPPPPTP